MTRIPLAKKTNDGKKITFVQSFVRTNLQGVGCCTMLSASIAMKMQHLRYRFFDFIYGINFWEGSIKSVEGLFGTGVGSYFRFLKVSNIEKLGTLLEDVSDGW